MHETDPSDDSGTLNFKPNRETDIALSEEEAAELANLQPAERLWQPPEDFPEDLSGEMPGEEVVQTMHKDYFGPDPSPEWTLELARAFVNVGRKKTYRLWKEGKLIPFKR